MLFAQILQCFLVLFHLSYKLGNSLLYLSYMSCMLFSYVLQLLVDLSLFGQVICKFHCLYDLPCFSDFLGSADFFFSGQAICNFFCLLDHLRFSELLGFASFFFGQVICKFHFLYDLLSFRKFLGFAGFFFSGQAICKFFCLLDHLRFSELLGFASFFFGQAICKFHFLYDLLSFRKFLGFAGYFYSQAICQFLCLLHLLSFSKFLGFAGFFFYGRLLFAGLILVLDLLDQLGVLLDHADRGPCFLCFLLLVFVHLLLGIDDFLFVFFHRLVRPLRFIDFLLLVTGFSLPLFIIHHLRYLYLLLFNFSRSLFNILLRF